MQKLTEENIRALIEASETNGIALKGISDSDYHSCAGISSSDLKKVINGNIQKWEHSKISKSDTQAMKLGRAVHCYTLEKKEFYRRYYCLADIEQAPSRRTKAGQDAYNEWAKGQPAGTKLELSAFEWEQEHFKWKNPDFKKEYISSVELDACRGIRSSIYNHPTIPKILSEENEISIFWIDKDTGLLCKARPDVLNKSFPCVADVKTCTSAELADFEHDLTKYDYHLSAYWYLHGCKQVFAMDFEQFIFIACEKQPPYQVALYPIDEGALSLGEALCKAGLAIFKRFFDGKQKWNGISTDIKTVTVRPYAYNKLQEIIYRHNLQGIGLEKYLT